MSILHEIIQHKKSEVQKRQREKPLSSLFSNVREQRPVVPFAASLKQTQEVAIIAEIKKASPSAGVIREDFNPVKIAESYAGNGATAISVLTDETYFSGSDEYLQQIRKAVHLPLLRKDFMIDPYQIVESRALGADAVLLIVGALAEDQCRELAASVREYGLAFLVEVHTVKEIEFALGEDYPLIGINNRDLDSFTTDLATTEKLAGIALAETTVVSESGIKKRRDVERLSRAGIDAVLIGESLMRQPNPGEALEEFSGIVKCPR